MDTVLDNYRKRARVILKYSEDGLKLGPIVYVVAGPLQNDMGEPFFLVVEPKEDAIPTIARAVRFE